MKKIFIIILLPLIIITVIILLHKPQKNVEKKPTDVVKYTIKTEAPYIKKNIDEVNALVELSNKEKARVIEIKDINEVKKINKIFNKAYNGDLVILLPDKSIIYDPSTKTVRDISNIVLYDSF